MTKSWFHLMSSLSSQLSRSRKPVLIFEINSMRISHYTRELISLLDIISLRICSLKLFFVYNDCIYKQIHGCAMGSPVSPVVANLCMKVIEDSALSISTVPPKIWKGYVDDSFVIIKKDSVSAFHGIRLNSIDPKISFIIETENNGQIAFLDTLVTRKNGVITIDVYRKPTHTQIDIWITLHIMRRNTKSALLPLS